MKVAQSLGESSQKHIAVRLMNLSDRDLRLFKGTVLGVAQAVIEEMDSLGKEDVEKVENKCMSVCNTGVK